MNQNTDIGILVKQNIKKNIGKDYVYQKMS